MDTHKILLFGDAADAPIPLIRHLLARSGSSEEVQTLIRNVMDAVSREMQDLLPSERESIGNIQTLQEWQECYENDRDRYGVARLIMLYVARIGELILHAKKDSLILSDSSKTSVTALGISGSLIPAAAAAVADNVSELIEVAAYLAAVTCRLGVQIARRAMEIEDNSGDWAFSILGSTINLLPNIIDTYHKNQAIPPHRKAYIGIQASTWATVFGPPSVLKSLLESSQELKEADILKTSTWGPVHAPHLILPNLRWLIGESSLLGKRVKSNFKIISCSNYKPIPPSDLGSLLNHILEDIFQHRTHIDQLFENAVALLDRAQEISLFVLGNTPYLPSLRRLLQRKGLKAALKPTSTQSAPERYDGAMSVAIVGMSGRFPGSDDVEGLWTSVMQQKAHHRKIPPDRFDVRNYTQHGSKNVITAPYGCFLEQPGLFDHKLFNISPREAMQTDPGYRLLMHTTYEAIENAGITTNGSRATNSRAMSSFIGIGIDDWREVQESVGVDIYMTQGTERAMAPGRLNHHFKWEGASHCVDSACGSAATAVGLAFRALVDRDCDTAVAGGTNIIAAPFWYSTLSQGGFLSPTGGCKTFQQDADGYCRGEAVGVLVLKRLEDALADNDNIKAIIRGYGRNHSAEARSIVQPHAQTQERLYRSVLHKSGLGAHEITYVEFHGTGTSAGDSAELESVASVFASPGSREKPLYVGAIKANVGHSEAASAVPSLIKAVMMFEKEIIPPQVGSPEKLGPYPCLRDGRIQVPYRSLPFTSGESVRRILVNNFDAAGGNSCFILEEPPRPRMKGSDPRAFHIVTCSGYSAASLDQNRQRMLQFLNDNQGIDLTGLAYTTTARRTHHAFRAAYAASSIPDTIEALTKDISIEDRGPRRQIMGAPLIFVYGGQGGNYEGAARDLFETSANFRNEVIDLERICKSLGLPSFTDLISTSSTRSDIVSIVQVHLAIVGLEIALTNMWRSWGIEPDIVVGHSLGEYAALYASGVLSAFDALFLVGSRAKLIQSTCVAGSHAMLSLSGPANEIAALLSEEDLNFLKDCEVACFNSPGSIVLSGSHSHILGLQSITESRGFQTHLLSIPYGMHSRQMDLLLPSFTDILRGVRFNEPKIKIVSTLLGRPVTKASIIDGDYLIRQTREPVKFQQAIAAYMSDELDHSNSVWIGVGPDASSQGLVRANIKSRSVEVLTTLKRGENNWRSITSLLAAIYQAGRSINWQEYHKEYLNNLSLINLPRYAFDTRKFWTTYNDSQQLSNEHEQLSNLNEESQHISTSLHRCLSCTLTEHAQSASFISSIAYPPLLKMIEGHRLSSIAVCPAAIFIDMALRAAQYLLTGGNTGKLTTSCPPLAVCDLQMDHPVVPALDPQKVLQIDITRSKPTGMDLTVVFRDHAKSTAIARCVVHIPNLSGLESKGLQLSSVRSRILHLVEAAAEGLADRIRGKVFYKLFSQLMTYSENYRGVEGAIVSDDFREILTDVCSPADNEKDPDGKFFLEPHMIDMFSQALGFLLNAKPDQSSDFVCMGTYVERVDFKIRDFPPRARYRVYAHVETSKGPVQHGNVYVFQDEEMVGMLGGIRFHRMPRKYLLQILGQPDAVVSQRNPQGHDTTESDTIPLDMADQAAVQVPVDSQEVNKKDIPLATTLLETLLDETGLLTSELMPSASFFELGVDSLMCMSVIAAFKAKTGLGLGASFLIDNPTLADAQRALRIVDNQTPNATMQGTLTIEEQADKMPDSHQRKCNVQLMSGRQDMPLAIPLFLIVDGAGSAAAYIHLPKMSRDLQVYAIESPWVHNPEEFTQPFPKAATLYLIALRSVQPHGPYLLGGWSAGGVFAYEVARLLLLSGEKILGLLIIDIPAPRAVEQSIVDLPTLEILSRIGMLSSIDRNVHSASPQALQLKQHMLSTVKCFSAMKPILMPIGRRPEATFVIWAKEGFGREVAQGMKTDLPGQNLDAWFYPTEHDFGPNGWEVLTQGQVTCLQVEGDHFSMMTPPKVTQLGQTMQEIVEKCLAFED